MAHSPAASLGSVITDPVQPTLPGERIALLDMLRGFALFGILLVNMQLFAAPLATLMLGIRRWPDPLERAIEIGIMYFAQGKFITLFSFLFGLGFSIILIRLEAKGARAGRVYARRLLALLAIGLIHALLIWMGDILVTYAVTGFFLLLFRRRRPKTILVWALILVLLPGVIFMGLAGFIELGRLTPQGAAEIDKSFAEQRADLERMNDLAMHAYARGSFAELQRARVKEATTVWTFLIFFAPNVLGIFLLGLYAGRRGIFQDVPANLPLIRRVQRWGLVLGFTGNLYVIYAMLNAPPAVPSYLGASGSLVGAIAVPAMSLFYASTLVLLWQKGAWRKWLAAMAFPGRMALSNYLLQSLVATTIFYSYGLGFYGRLRPSMAVLLTVAIYLAQIPCSRWWLSRYQFGPAEWLWRSLTYGRMQPMRLPQPRAAAGA